MIRRYAALKRSAKPIARGSSLRKRRHGPPRCGPAGIPADEWRNPEYLAFLREEGRCMNCGARECDPAHGPVNGTSSKGPDAQAGPLCRLCHIEQTAIGWPAFEAKYHFSREKEVPLWWAAFQILGNYIHEYS